MMAWLSQLQAESPNAARIIMSPGKLTWCPPLKSKSPETPLRVPQLCAEDLGAWNGLNVPPDGDGEMRRWSVLGHSLAAPLGSLASVCPLTDPKASLLGRNAPVDTAQMSK